MTNKELKERIKALEELKREVKASKEIARNLLDKSGIYTKSGRLKKQYR